MKKMMVLALVAFLVPGVFAQGVGVIKGKVKTEIGAAPGVLVQISRMDGGDFLDFTTTDDNGQFFLGKLKAGSYRLEFSSVSFETLLKENIQVQGNQVVDLDIKMKSAGTVMEILTVASVSRRPERIVEAPGAVTVITANDLENNATHHQFPRLLNNAPSVELAQNGLFDYNLNARGFNSTVNRRILVLLDGRDISVGLLGAQEWNTMSYPIDEISSLEFVRGPGSALFGANAFNGVLNLKTKRPKDTPGGKLTLTGGDPSNYGVDFRYAGTIDDRLSYRLTTGIYSAESWSTSRTESTPYAGLPYELVAPDDDDVSSTYYNGRIDYELLNGHVFTAELGTGIGENAIALSGIGRVQVNKVNRPWYRLNYKGQKFNLSYWRSERDTPDGMTSLQSGGVIYEDYNSDHVELQFNHTFMKDKIDLVLGSAFQKQNINSLNPDGFQTLLRSSRDEDQKAVFGQLTFRMGKKFDFILAGRWDDSSLHEAETSPKAALVWKPSRNHSFRLTYNKAFQTPSYSEFFLYSSAGTATGLAQLQAGLEAQLGTQLPLNFESVPILAFGNEELEVETNETIEIGYKGIFASRLFVTFDYYQSTLSNFVTDLLPGVNSTLLNQLNASDPYYSGQYQAYEVPEFIPGPIAAIIEAQLALAQLQNALFTRNGQNVVAISYGNAGEVELDGFEFAFNYYVTDNFSIDGNYASFDYKIVELTGDENLFSPNASDSKYNFGVSYSGEQFGASLHFKHVTSFDWSSGIFQGAVPDYDLIDLTSFYRFNDYFKVNLMVSNASEEEHFEVFGGSVIGRRMMLGLNINF